MTAERKKAISGAFAKLIVAAAILDPETQESELPRGRVEPVRRLVREALGLLEPLLDQEPIGDATGGAER